MQIVIKERNKISALYQNEKMYKTDFYIYKTGKRTINFYKQQFRQKAGKQKISYLFPELSPTETTGWDDAVLSLTNTPAGADSRLRAAVFNVNWSSWLVTFPMDDKAADLCKSAGPGVIDLSKSEAVFPAAIGVADDLKSNMSADGVIERPNNNTHKGRCLVRWYWCCKIRYNLGCVS